MTGGGGVLHFSETSLQHYSRGPDGRDDHDRQGTVERPAVGEHHYQGQASAQQCGGDDGPAAMKGTWGHGS